MNVNVKLNELMPNEFYANDDGKLYAEITLEQINKITDILLYQQQRIDKAIEYINEMCLCSDGYCDYGDDLRPEHIVNLLQGEDKE